MKVVLAEKPSVARDLAAVLGATTRREGFLEGNGYQVTWAFGHLVTLKEPEDYDPALKRWTLDALPILPASFGLKLTGDEGARRQFGIVQTLFQAADELICATDAGREGELIFRYILELSGCATKPVQRLWLNSMTEDAIRGALRRLAPAAQYDDLYAAARCRSEADWIIGMNATRNYTVRYGQSGVLWSVGRVQTPVLALIVGRDDEIRHFVAAAWFEVRTHYRGILFKWQGNRLPTAEAAAAILDAVIDRPFSITKVETRPEQELPPQLFDLTALQREMNVRHGMSAADVLVQAQALYESKLITYPRTDSRYLPAGMRGEVADILRRIGAKQRAVADIPLDDLPVDRRVFDDSKVSDHHAILPTGRPPGPLPETAQRVYDAIVTRLIAAFLPPCRKEVTTVDGLAGGQAFRARGVRIVDPGWTILQPKVEGKGRRKSQGKNKGKSKGEGEDADEDDDQQELPSLTAGESGPHRPKVKPGETRPPRHYNENTLLAAMETAGKLVDDDELKEALKARGLGTPATRAAIIETLLRRAYIRREKKSLIATDLGRYLIALIQHPILKSPEMTGEWEARLREVEAGRLEGKAFMQGIASFTAELINGDHRTDPSAPGIGACPRCGKEIVEGQRGFGCSGWRQGCGFVLWKDYRGHVIPRQQARELLQRRISLRPFPLAGERFVLALDDAGRASHIALPRREHQRGAPPETPRSRRAKPASRGAARPANKPAGRPAATARCPRCGGGMVERVDAYGCAAAPGQCGFAIPKTIAGKSITKAMARSLLLRGRTQVLKGFTSKSQRKFDARLELEDGRVRFRFDGGGAQQDA